MRRLNIIPLSQVNDLTGKSIMLRDSTRCISLKGDSILMLYTQRYDDYSLPGGGLDDGEDKVSGFIRELKEETGAKNIRNIKEFGIYEEYRQWYKDDFDIQNIVSYCYTCDVDTELGQTHYESYETNNGMRPVWINIQRAISHNESIIASSSKKGLSIERETFLLRLIEKELVD